MTHFIKKLFSVFLVLLFILNISSSFVSAEYVLTNNYSEIPSAVFNYAGITDSYEGTDKDITVLIQDLHNDYSIQKNIYKTIDLLTKEKNFTVYGEGIVNGELDVSVLKDIPNNRIKNYTIKNLFENSVLSAYEYYALVNNKTVKGIEDKKIYFENLKLYDDIIENKSFNNALIDEALSRMNYVKRYFIEDKIAAIKSFNFTKFSFDEKEYPNLQKYKTVLQNKSQLNINKLNKQFKKFVSEYRFSGELYSILKLDTQYGYVQLYDYINKNLKDVAKNNKELMSFLENNKLMSEINPVNLLYEQQSLSNNLLTKESLEQTDKEMLYLEKSCLYLKDLVNMNILPENYTELKNNKKYIKELIKKYLPKNEAAFALAIINNKDFFTFYDNNFERNKIFAKILINDNSNKIVVAGGFHKDLTAELKNSKKSYIVLTPNFSTSKYAFNKLFSEAFQTGFNKDSADNLLTVLYSWRTFFKDINSFQKEVNSWIENSKFLSDNNVEITISENKISIKCNNTIFEKTFSEKQTVKKELDVTKKQLEETVNNILGLAQNITLFGPSVKVKISADDSLLKNVIPATVKTEKDIPVIYVNEKFLKVLNQNFSLTDFFVRFLYLYSSPYLNADEMYRFINDNSDKFEKFYNLKKQVELSVSPKNKTKTKFSIFEIFEKIKVFVGKNVNYELPAGRNFTPDEENMNSALAEVTKARRERSFITSFIQPPIGAYIKLNVDVSEDDNVSANKNTVTVIGKGFNESKSLLHAETMTFINFFKDYIDKFEKLPNGELTEKGKFFNNLLDLVLVNGQDTKNKIFLKNPIIFKNLDIDIDYSKTRDINTVFDETNAVLKFIDKEFGCPLSKTTLYCTLAPCNKCAKTMETLGINRLVFGSYSANKKHKGLKNLEEKGIKYTGGVLEPFCDEAIRNYRFMNATLFRTRIASFMQKIRRFLFLSKKYNRKIVQDLIDKVLSFDSNNATKVKDLEYLQKNLNWQNLQEDMQVLDKLIEFLKSIDAYDEPAKRAGIMYVLKNKCSFDMKDGNIYFYNSDGQKLAFYITPLGKFAASQNYFDKMEQVCQVRNFSDIDDHLALRGMPFNDKVRRVFSILTLYGIANPIPVTGNILELTKMRLDPLGTQITNLIPYVYIENAAIRCNIKDGEYIYDQNYMENIAKSKVEEETLVYLRDMFLDIGKDWYYLFVFFANEIKNLRNNDDLTYTEMVNVVLEKYTASNGYNIPDFMKKLIAEWGTLTRAEASEKLKEIYEFSLRENFSKQEFLDILKIASFMELSRLYFSESAEDKKEAVRLKQDFEKLYADEDLSGNFESPVRFVISPFRPNLVRETFVLYARPIVQAKFPDLKVESTGQTTFSIYKTGVDKGVPIRAEMASGTLGEDIISSGDELNSGGVDYPPYLMSQVLPECKDMVVVNTNSNTFEGSFITLINNKKFSQDETVSGNIERSLAFQQIILDVVEENVAKIASDPEYEPVQVAQEVKRRLLEDDTDIIPPYDILEDTKFSEQLEKEDAAIMDMLQAA